MQSLKTSGSHASKLQSFKLFDSEIKVVNLAHESKDSVEPLYKISNLKDSGVTVMDDICKIISHASSFSFIGFFLSKFLSQFMQNCLVSAMLYSIGYYLQEIRTFSSFFKQKTYTH
jgi:hypothetical protein